MNINSFEAIELNGLKARDIITGIEGVVTCVSFDLYGCIQIVITPPVKEGGQATEARWYDVCRVQILDSHPVIPRPDFALNKQIEFQFPDQISSEKPILKGPDNKPKGRF